MRVCLSVRGLMFMLSGPFIVFGSFYGFSRLRDIYMYGSGWKVACVFVYISVVCLCFLLYVVCEMFVE